MELIKIVFVQKNCSGVYGYMMYCQLYLILMAEADFVCESSLKGPFSQWDHPMCRFFFVFFSSPDLFFNAAIWAENKQQMYIVRANKKFNMRTFFPLPEHSDKLPPMRHMMWWTNHNDQTSSIINVWIWFVACQLGWNIWCCLPSTHLPKIQDAVPPPPLYVRQFAAPGWHNRNMPALFHIRQSMPNFNLR